jgi:hypothetical protein
VFTSSVVKDEVLEVANLASLPGVRTEGLGDAFVILIG